MQFRTIPGTQGSHTMLVAIAFLLSACTTTSVPATSSTPTAGSTAPASSGAPASPAVASLGSAGIPSNDCAPVTAADVEAAYGGSSSPGKIDENGHCAFDVSGNIHAGPNAGVPGGVGVSFNDRYTTFADAKVVFGDAVTKVDGLGAEAWWALQTVHVKIAGGEMTVIGLWVGTFDKAIIKKDTITLARAILSHL